MRKIIRAYLPFIIGYLLVACSAWSQWEVELIGEDTVGNQLGSLAIDGSQRPHVSYVARTSVGDDLKILKYASDNGSEWDVEEVIEERRVEDGVKWTKILTRVSMDGQPIIYYNFWDPQRELTKIRRAFKADGRWTVETLFTRAADLDFALDEDNRLHILYAHRELDETGERIISRLFYLRPEGERAWITHLVEERVAADELIQRFRIAVDSQRRAHIVYARHSQDDVQLLYTRRDGSNQIESEAAGRNIRINSYFFLGEEWDPGQTKMFRDAVFKIALGPADEPHICYPTEAEGGRIAYMHANRTGPAAWRSRVVADDLAFPINFGIIVDSHNAPHIAYRTASFPYELRLARWNGFYFEEEATCISAEGEDGDLDFISLALDSEDRAHLLYQKTTASTNEVFYAHPLSPEDIFGPWEELEGIPGGSVPALAVSPMKKSHVYAGTYRRGLYRSTDAGESWEAGSDFIAASTVDLIAVHPDDPERIYVHAHDGEKSKLLMSVNGGYSFSLSWGFSRYDRITALALDRNNPRKLYVGFRPPHLVMIYDDAPWAFPIAIPGEGEEVSTIYAEESRTNLGNILIVGLKNPEEGSSALYRSNDGGRDLDPFVGNLPPDASGDFFLAATSYDEHAWFHKYMVNSRSPLRERGVYRRRFRGGSPYTDGLGHTEWTYTGGPGLDLRGESRIITALAGNNHLLVSGVSAEEKGPDLNNRVYLARVHEDSKGVEIMEDWVPYKEGIPRDVIVSALACSQPERKLERTLLFCGTANNTLENGTFPGPGGDGVYGSYEGGDVWEKINNGIHNAGITALGGTTDHLYAGTVRGEIHESFDNGKSWTKTGIRDLPYPGTIKGIKLDAASGTAYALAENALLIRVHTPKLPEWFPLGGKNGLPGVPGAIALDPGRPGRIYAGLPGFGIYLSTNGGFSWSRISAEDAAGAAIAVSPSGGVLYGVSAGGGVIYRSTDEGRSWESLHDTGLTNYKEAHLAIATGKDGGAGPVYASIGGDLYYSPDGERDWRLVKRFTRTWQIRVFGSEGSIDIPIEITGLQTHPSLDGLALVSVGDWFNEPVEEGGVYYAIPNTCGSAYLHPLKDGLKTLDVTAFTLVPSGREEELPTLYCGLLCGGIYRAQERPPSVWWLPGEEGIPDIGDIPPFWEVLLDDEPGISGGK